MEKNAGSGQALKVVFPQALKSTCTTASLSHREHLDLLYMMLGDTFLLWNMIHDSQLGLIIFNFHGWSLSKLGFLLYWAGPRLV